MAVIFDAERVQCVADTLALEVAGPRLPIGVHAAARILHAVVGLPLAASRFIPGVVAFRRRNVGALRRRPAKAALRQVTQCAERTFD